MKQQFSFPWELKPAMQRQDYMVSSCNQAALEWAELWPHWGSYASLIWGPKNSGKTHLAHIWAKKSEALFLDPALPEQDVMNIALVQKSLVLDDVAQWLSREELLLHCLNAAKNKNGYILLLAEKPSQQWGVRLPDLASRLNALPQIEIFTPDDDMLRMLLVKLFADRQLQVSPDAIDYAVARLDRSYAALQEFVAATDRISLENRRNITISLIRDIIQAADHD